MTRSTVLALALCVVAAAADAQAPATKAPATPEKPGLLTRIKRMVGLEKEPAPAPATKTAPVTRDTAAATKQGTKTPATKQDAKAAPGTKQGTKAAATKQDTKAAAPAPTKTAPAPAPAPTKTTPAPATPATRMTVAPETPAARVPTILREVFDYDAEGRRDPFFSLLTTTDLRPTLADLRLTGVILDPSGRRSVAIMREAGTNTQYRVTTGMMLGRMRVALIKARAVIFSIEEFGLNRQDSLVLGDTTKARAK